MVGQLKGKEKPDLKSISIK